MSGLFPRANNPPHNHQRNAPVSCVYEDVFEGFSFEDGVDAEDGKSEEETGEETVECAVFEGAEVVSVVGHEFFEVDINGGIIDAVSGFIHEGRLDVQLVDDDVWKNHRQEETQEQRED